MFEKYFKYNSDIKIVKLKNNKYSLKQNNIIKAKIKINNNFYYEDNINNFILNKFKFYKIKKISSRKKKFKIII